MSKTKWLMIKYKSRAYFSAKFVLVKVYLNLGSKIKLVTKTIFLLSAITRVFVNEIVQKFG